MNKLFLQLDALAGHFLIPRRIVARQTPTAQLRFSKQRSSTSPTFHELRGKMKSVLHLISTDSSTSVRTRTKSVPSRDFVSLTETKALMARSFAVCQQRLQAGDMVSTDEEAQMTGKSRVRISANVTGDFWNVTGFGSMLSCARQIVEMSVV